MALGDFPCKIRANTNEFNQGHERTFNGAYKKTFCPYCKVSVSEGDTSCWQCKEELTPDMLDRL